MANAGCAELSIVLEVKNQRRKSKAVRRVLGSEWFWAHTTRLLEAEHERAERFQSRATNLATALVVVVAGGYSLVAVAAMQDLYLWVRIVVTCAISIATVLAIVCLGLIWKLARPAAYSSPARPKRFAAWVTGYCDLIESHRDPEAAARFENYGALVDAHSATVDQNAQRMKCFKMALAIIVVLAIAVVIFGAAMALPALWTTKESSNGG